MRKQYLNLCFLMGLLMNFTSCGNFMNKLYSDLDKGDAKARKGKRKKRDRFAHFRNQQRDRYNQQRGRLNSNYQNNVSPYVKRQYRPENIVKKRYKANDLNDNNYDGSLWAGNGRENYLFSINKAKKNGDIILLNIFNTLKNDITLELKRAFPTFKKPTKKKEGEEGKDPAKTAEAPPKEENKEEAAEAGPNKVQDRMSTVVIEEINKDHLLIRGQKYLLYKNRKRLVEVQALVARRDIGDDDSVNSDNVLESSIDVIR